MKTMSIMGSPAKVIHKIEKYLAKRGYKHVEIDYKSGEIKAERKKIFFLRGDHVLLKIKQAEKESTNIELTLNPERTQKTFLEEQRELKLRNKMIFYL
jgi:hypothetical protein